MNHKQINLLLLLFFCMVNSLLFSQKMVLQKTGKAALPRQHPYTKLLVQARPEISNSSNRAHTAKEFSRLLVILVDFTFESPDDPNTTGDGKFMLEADPTYLYSVGAPPHNQEYFDANLQALSYYYKAVSAESFQLDYDIYPQNKPAYTLPHPMGYYNPVGASSELFVSRIEEYFKSAFEIADSDDPEIDFSSYSHFMIIHAGSDWQHDVLQDTPSDIPSFYIKVGSGKEAVVDGGNTLISHASNVPATISQDFIDSNAQGTIIHSGYGALNSVLAHEFGHSLGMVDLYNVYNYSPMVGVFDIMDSGGSGILADDRASGYEGDIFLVEGALPSFPGAFSRNLMFQDFYAEKGYLKDLSQMQPFTNQSLFTISAKQDIINIIPHTYKIPLNNKEYILVENRSVDPDGDGGTAVFGTLDGRVILYPTILEENQQNLPTYEYDYLLPSFQKADGSAVGGGILVWHVNESIIYDEGFTDSNGIWVSNFENNTVNTDVNRRGVSVIEADGLNDLGSDYSMYWTGTPFEYFHARKPILNTLGQFVSWSNTTWKPELKANSKPPLRDSNGLAGFYGLSQMGNPSPVMSFNLSSGFFAKTTVESFGSPSLIATDMLNSGFSDYDLPVLGGGFINLLSRQDEGWQNLMGAFPDVQGFHTYPPQKADNNGDGFYELVAVLDNNLQFMDFSQDELTTYAINFPSAITSTPLCIDTNVFATTADCLYQMHNYEISGFISVSGVLKMAGTEEVIAVLGNNFIKILSSQNLEMRSEYTLPEAFGNIEPLIYINPLDASYTVYLMANSGNLYCLRQEKLTQIFINHSADTPGQIALSKLGNISPVLFFGIGNNLYAMKADGSMVSGFPITSKYPVSASESPMALRLDAQDLMYYPLQDHGYLAVDSSGSQLPQWSLAWNRGIKNDFLFYQADQANLYWYYTDTLGKLFIHELPELPENPILFAGYRNGGSGVYIAPLSDDVLSDPAFSAYIYPNPVKRSYFRLHLNNATGTTNLHIYDISGALVAKQTISESLNNPRDLEINSQKLRSGVYILSLENNGRHKRLKFAVEK